MRFCRISFWLTLANISQDLRTECRDNRMEKCFRVVAVVAAAVGTSGQNQCIGEFPILQSKYVISIYNKYSERLKKLYKTFSHTHHRSH